MSYMVTVYLVSSHAQCLEKTSFDINLLKCPIPLFSFCKELSTNCCLFVQFFIYITSSSNGMKCCNVYQIYYLRSGEYFITQVFQAFVSLSHATWHFHVSPFLDMSWYNVTLLCPRHLLYYHCHNTSLNYISKVLLMGNITQTKSQNGHSG